MQLLENILKQIPDNIKDSKKIEIALEILLYLEKTEFNLNEEDPLVIRAFIENYLDRRNDCLRKAYDYLTSKHNIEISFEDFEKIICYNPTGEDDELYESVDDALRLGLFDVDIAVQGGHHIRVTINGKRGVPKYFCRHDQIINRILSEDY